MQSGSDATCDQPLADDWLPISQVRIGEQLLQANGQYEINIPHEAGRMTIELFEPPDDTVGLELDIVRRRPTAEPAKSKS